MHESRQFLRFVVMRVALGIILAAGFACAGFRTTPSHPPSVIRDLMEDIGPCVVATPMDDCLRGVHHDLAEGSHPNYPRVILKEPKGLACGASAIVTEAWFEEQSTSTDGPVYVELHAWYEFGDCASVRSCLERTLSEPGIRRTGLDHVVIWHSAAGYSASLQSAEGAVPHGCRLTLSSPGEAD